MESKSNNLSLRFQTKGFTPIEIPGLIKDIFAIIDKGRYFNKTVVNQELEDLGWGVDIMDTVTYKIIVSNSWVQ
jgi:hypothetical protein